MPELPEVETIRRQLGPVVAGRTVTEAWAHPSPKFAPALDAVGSTLGRVRRRGKYLLVDLDRAQGPGELVVHLGMTGSLRPVPAAETVDPYVRARWWFDDGSALWFRDVRRFGRIAVVDHGDHTALPTLAALGPEPLGEDFTPEGLWAAVRRSRRHLKTQLLSQRVVAGVGNIYADEALWRAGVHPAQRRLSRADATRLHTTLREVLAAAVADGGTTLRDYVTVEGEVGGHQDHLDCYGRAGEPCRRCGQLLRRTIVDARSTTFCPTCQRRR